MRMEQPSTIPFLGEAGREGQALEGLFVPGDPEGNGVLVAPPHPLYGGSILNPVVTELALRSQTLGLTSLRFNWRGVGASAGTHSGELADSLADYAAALEFFEDCIQGAIVACGYSWGAGAAVLATRGRPKVRRLLLVAPPAAMLDRGALADFPGEIMIAVGDRDELAQPSELETIAAGLPKGHFVLLEDTDHFFGSGPAALGREAEKWLGRFA